MFNLKKCNICPRMCGIDRITGTGYCGAGDKIEVAKIMCHHWEEPPISGDSEKDVGSGTIFFAHCPLGCVYCQNGKISRRHSSGKKMTVEELAHEMISLQKAGVYNINLVSPTHYTPQIIEAVRIAKNALDPLTIPVVWNTGGYERPEMISMLRDTVDIFLTDFKYSSSSLAKLYSSAEDYPYYAAESLAEMVRITDGCKFDENGIMKRGVIVRHLALPSHREDSINVLQKIKETVDPLKIKLSLMAQYTPEFLPHLPSDSDKFAKIRRKITSFEYNKIAEEASRLGFDGYMQERSSATSKFTPDF